MRTMGVKGLTLFHLKSHLQVHAVHASFSDSFKSATPFLSLLLISANQKYRLGRQAGKELVEQTKDGKLCISETSNWHASMLYSSLPWVSHILTFLGYWISDRSPSLIFPYKSSLNYWSPLGMRNCHLPVCYDTRNNKSIIIIIDWLLGI